MRWIGFSKRKLSVHCLGNRSRRVDRQHWYRQSQLHRVCNGCDVWLAQGYWQRAGSQPQKSEFEVANDSYERITLGAGTDIVTGNANIAANISGGDGNGILLGGAGNDSLLGRGGNDILIGRAGADSLVEDFGAVILIGGTTSFDTNMTTLMAIRDEWVQAIPYEARVDHLRNGGGLNGTIRLAPSTVTQDISKDTLTGGLDNDWFWIASPDTSDATGDESIN